MDSALVQRKLNALSAENSLRKSLCFSVILSLGHPGILLLAAKQGSTLREEHDSFVEQIAKALEQEIREKIDNTAVDILKLLSLLEYVEIKGRSYREIIESCLLVIEAIKTTLYRWGYHFLREGKGNKPFDPMPQMTWGDVWSYQEALLMLLVQLAQFDEPQVAESARQVLPTVV